MEKKLRKICLTYYNLIIASDLWHALYQIFVNNLSKRLHRIQCKLGHDDKKCKILKLNISIATVLFNTQILKII